MEGYRFDGFEIDTARREVRHDGRPIPVDRQVFDVIAYLAANADRVVPRTEVLDAVWGDRFVSDSALSTRIKTARRALGDDGRTQHRIVTVRGVGYRFVLDDTDTVADDRAADDLGPGVAVPKGGPGADPLPSSIGGDGAWEELVGREAESSASERLLAAGRSATLVGPGGVGKTRLALDVARRAGPGFVDGTHVVELAPVRADADVAPAVAAVIGVRPARDEGVLDALTRILAERQALLVVDNCEHVARGALEMITVVTRSCPTVVVLATSRAPVGYPGEHLVPVPPLASRPAAAPGGAAPSAETLFRRRLAAVAPAVEADPELVAAICHRLDGIPLALELAAGRARALGLAALHDRLDESLALLGANRLDPRHRTLRDTIGWSYDLLGPDGQRLLARASVFAGPFTLSAAEAVLADDLLPPAAVITGMAELADASLVQTVDRDGAHRFRLLETIRQFGRDVGDPDDLSATAERFVAHLVDTADQVGRRLLADADPARWFRTGDDELDNLREAARLALAVDDHDSVLAIARSLCEWSYLSVTDDPPTWAGWVADRVGPDDRRYPQALALAAYQAASRGRPEDLIDELSALSERAAAEPWVPRALSLLHWFAGNSAEADASIRTVIGHWEATGDRGAWAYSVALRSMILDAIDRPGARAAAEATLAAAEELDSSVLRASGLIVLAGTLAHTEPSATLAVADEMVEVSRATGSRWHVATSLRVRAHLLSRAGHLGEADRAFRETLEANGIGDRGEYLWYTILNLIDHLMRRDRDADAAVALGAYVRSPAAIHDGLVERALERTRGRLRERLGSMAVAELEAEGAAMSQAALLDRLRSAVAAG